MQDHSHGLEKYIQWIRFMEMKGRVAHSCTPWPLINALPWSFRVSRSVSADKWGIHFFLVEMTLGKMLYWSLSILSANTGYPGEPCVGTGCQYSRSTSSTVRCIRLRTLGGRGVWGGFWLIVWRYRENLISAFRMTRKTFRRSIVPLLSVTSWNAGREGALDENDSRRHLSSAVT